MGTLHLAQSQKKAADNAKFSVQMFPSRTAADRQATKRKFSVDFMRCTAEYNQAIRKYRSDTEKLVYTLSFATDAINDCLSGTSCDADVPVHSIPWYAVVLRKSVGRKSTSHLKAGHYIPQRMTRMSCLI